MAICSVCYENCRGTCPKCGKSLCSKCRPKSARSKCPVCPASTRGSAAQVVGNAYYTPTHPQAQAAFNAATPTTHHRSGRGAAAPSSRPPVRPPAPMLPDYESLQPDAIKQHILSLSERLARKQTRELAYLQRRYDRGTYTPTDESYGQDQILEDELLALLAFIAAKTDE